VQTFPILAKPMVERYQPVARTGEAAIYRQRDYRPLAHDGEGATNNR
jgi:hypothetical protein